MLLSEFQAATRVTAIYPGAGEGANEAIDYTILGLVSEAGEVAGKWKKVLRDHGGVLTPAARSDLLAEVGDVLWYIARLADELGANLDDVANANLAKLEARRMSGTLTGSGDNR